MLHFYVVSNIYELFFNGFRLKQQETIITVIKKGERNCIDTLSTIIFTTHLVKYK